MAFATSVGGSDADPSPKQSSASSSRSWRTADGRPSSSSSGGRRRTTRMPTSCTGMRPEQPLIAWLPSRGTDQIVASSLRNRSPQIEIEATSFGEGAGDFHFGAGRREQRRSRRGLIAGKEPAL